MADVLTGDRYAVGTSLTGVTAQVSQLIGFLLGGALLVDFAPSAALLVDAATFAVSLLLVAAFVPVPRHPSAPEPAGAVAGGGRFIRRDAWMRPVTAAQALSQAAFMAMTAAIPVLAFASYDRDAKLAGLLLAVWGGGAMLGSVAAYRLVRSTEPFRLGAVAWTLQALPLWAISATRSPLLAALALGASGIANGIRVPPIAGLTLERVPQRIRAETMTVASSLVLGAGCVALLASGPALDHLGMGVIWAGIAALQTAAALIFGRAGAG
jgi:predicted MFS family arabinose efflux permease